MPEGEERETKLIKNDKFINYGSPNMWLNKLDFLEKHSPNPLDKVNLFLQNNPLCYHFVKREKGRLPYSVFKPHSERVFFIKSIFENRPPTVYFPYPKYCRVEVKSDRIREYDREDIEYLFMAFRINDTTHIYNAVVNSFKHSGF